CVGDRIGIYKFNGVITKGSVKEFREFLDKFKSDSENNLDSKQLPGGYLSNITYEKLIKDFEEIYKLMETGKCKYFVVG
ncbi:MAG: hypothetical protein ACRC68_08490, partial [Clostridium sp.]